MTSSNGNGNGHEPKGGKSAAFTPRHDVFFPPEVAAPATTSQMVNPAGASAVPTSGVEPSLAGLALPAEFNTGHFLDPAFLAGLANEMYDVGRPLPEPGMSTSGAPAAVRPEMLMQGEPMAFPDTCVFERMAQDFLPALGMPATAMPAMPAMPAPVAPPTGLPGATEGFYFLQQAATPVPAVPPGIALPTAPAAPPGHGAFYFLPSPTAAPAAVPTTPTSPLAPRQFDVEAIRQDFPILHQTVHGKPLIWFDNAATTQKPRQVIQALSRFYERDNSNVHRAAHALAARATNAFEEAREKVRRFLGAARVEEIVFVRGCTEGINLIAQSYGRKYIGPGDEIVLSQLEHHSNIVPWHQLAKEKGAVLRVVPVNDRGEILLDEYERLLGPRTKIVSLTHVSNALGTVLPVQTMTKMARRHGAVVVLDGAQSVPHLSVDVQSLDCDFYVFSGHKLFGPTGVGAVYGRHELLEAMPPWQGGGNMIDQVTFEEVTYQPPPMKFEAGTGILAGAVGLGAAIDYVEQLGMENIHRHEHELLVHATAGLGSIDGLRLIGTAAEKASVVSFVLDGVRTEDMGRYLDREGIAVRAGHHCAQPALRRFGLSSSVRPSLAFYNTHAEVDTLVAAVRRAKATL
jgi:cysteine desulfurase/selenocysteine lyase